MRYSIRLLDDPAVPVHRIVPLRFAREAQRMADGVKVDFDRRGFRTFPDARGPKIGVIAGRRIEIGVVRDRAGRSLRIYPTVSPAGVVEIREPAGANPFLGLGGRPVDTVILEAPRTLARDGRTVLSLRFGSPTGPVLAEASILAYTPLRLPICFHVPRVYESRLGIPLRWKILRARRLKSSLSDDFADLLIQQTNDVLESQVGITSVRVAPICRKGQAFYRVGTPARWREFAACRSCGAHPSALNVWILPPIAEAGGFAMTDESHRVRGIAVDSRQAALGFGQEIMVHEIGHMLGLLHYGGFDSDVPPGHMEDLWAHGNIIACSYLPCFPKQGKKHKGLPCRSTAARRETGYFDESWNNRAGLFVGSKRIPQLVQSIQTETMRRSMREEMYLPKLKSPLGDRESWYGHGKL